MECKVNVPEEAGGDPACIDLTRMECKVKFLCSADRRTDTYRFNQNGM